MATSALRSEQFTFGVKMLDGHKFASYTPVPRCNQSFFGGMDSSQHHSLHLAVRCLLTVTDRTTKIKH